MKITILLQFILISFTAFSQKNTTHQQLLWYAYYNTLQFGDKWFLTTEIQERHFIAPLAQHQFLLRSHLHYNLGKAWDVALGMCLFLQNPHNPLENNQLTVPELRPHWALARREKYRWGTLLQRYKIEARFFHNVVQGELVDGYTFANFRLRYQLGADIPIWKNKNITTNTISLKISNEIMLNVGENILYNVFDQNRIYLAVNYAFNDYLQIEGGYLNWYQQQKNGKDFYDRDIIRFIIFHKIKLY